MDATITCPHCKKPYLRPAWPFEHRQAVTIAIYEAAHPGKSILPLRCDRCQAITHELIVPLDTKARLLYRLGSVA